MEELGNDTIIVMVVAVVGILSHVMGAVCLNFMINTWQTSSKILANRTSIGMESTLEEVEAASVTVDNLLYLYYKRMRYCRRLLLCNTLGLICNAFLTCSVVRLMIDNDILAGLCMVVVCGWTLYCIQSGPDAVYTEQYDTWQCHIERLLELQDNYVALINTMKEEQEVRGKINISRHR